MAWIRETPDGLDIDVSAFAAEMEAVKGRSKKKIKELADTKLPEPSEDEANTVILKAGNQFFKMVAVTESSSIEDILREEYEARFEKEKKAMEVAGQEVISEFKAYANSILDQSREEIRVLKSRLMNSAPMPEITYGHARAGLSVAKGNDGELMWLFRTVYSPQYLNIHHISHQIKPSLVKKMVTPIIILITTKNDTVVSVSTRTLDLEAFRHYHRMRSGRGRDLGSDCWGAWKHSKTWKTADDILRIAKEAINVLTVINSDSIATNNPKGLPRFDTVRASIIERERVETTLNRTQDRAGVAGVAAARGGWNFDPSVIA